MPEPTDILCRARELIVKPSAWTHLCDAVDPDGHPIDFLDSAAARWSDLGAIRLAAHRIAGRGAPSGPTWTAIMAAEAHLETGYETIDAVLGPARDPTDPRDAYLAALHALEIAIRDAYDSDERPISCRVLFRQEA
ncbi:MAG: hypothetical protein OYH76_09060 [Defluviicoccus sp.]|nr:hypothetical protein [Defluviicoccus sp.]MDE0276032.1 hypothetical protein [Defluviicoccus sp.]